VGGICDRDVVARAEANADGNEVGRVVARMVVNSSLSNAAKSDVEEERTGS